MQPYLLKVCFVSTVAIDNPYLQNIIFTSVLISGFCWNQRAGRDLGEPYSLLSANRSSLLYLSRTLVQWPNDLPFLTEETEVLRGWVALWSILVIRYVVIPTSVISRITNCVDTCKTQRNRTFQVTNMQHYKIAHGEEWVLPPQERKSCRYGFWLHAANEL